MKRYGDTKTALELTPKAEYAYSATDPLDIYEYDTDDGPRYNVRGCAELTDASAADVIDLLESFFPGYSYQDAARAIVDAGKYAAAVELMDDDIRERLHRDTVARYGAISDADFLAAYMERHADEFGEEFTI